MAARMSHCYSLRHDGAKVEARHIGTAAPDQVPENVGLG